MRRPSPAAALLLAGLASACVELQGYVPATHGPDPVRERAFRIGAERTVSPGEPVIRVRDYVLTVRELSDAAASRDFTVHGGRIVVRVEGGRAYPIVGVRRVASGRVFVVEVDGGYALQVDASGVVGPTILHERVPLAPTFAVHPPDARLVPGEERTLEPVPGTRSYEIVYGGLVDARTFELVYRELGPDGSVLPGTEQRLAYARHTSEVRVHGFTLQVLETQGERLRCVVSEAPRELQTARPAQ